MAKYNLELDSFSSILDLCPDGDPYEEAEKLVKKVSEGLSPSQGARTDQGMPELKSIVDINRYNHPGGLSSDIKKLAGDYRAASKQFFTTIRNSR